MKPNSDGSLDYKNYTVFALPAPTLSSTSVVCGTLAQPCVLYIGDDYTAIATTPHVWSQPFYVTDNDGDDGGTNPGDGSAPASLTSQTISYSTTAPGSATVGGATYTPAAMATSGLPVTITLDAGSTGCSISGGGVVSFTGIGVCAIDANQGGNGTYGAAPQVQQFIPVLENQTISFTPPGPTTATIGGPTYTPAATATSTLPVTITLDSSSTGCSLSGAGVVSFTAVGNCVIDANQGRERQLQPRTAGARVDRRDGRLTRGPDHLVHHHRPDQRHRRRGHLLTGRHGHVGPAGNHHPGQRIDRVLPLGGRCGVVHRYRDLQDQRQPGRERHLQPAPQCSRSSPCWRTKPSRSLPRGRPPPLSVGPPTRQSPPPPRHCR